MNFKPLLFLAFLLSGMAAVNAQQRKCEFSVTLLSPSEGATIQAYAQYNVTVRITNNGADSLRVGDTLWYNTSSMPLISYATYALAQPIYAGSSADITLQTNANVNTNTDDATLTYYVTVLPRPDTLGAVRDTFLTNNTDGNTITFKPCESGTAVNTVNAKDIHLNIYPNPAKSFVELKTTIANMKQVVIADISGRTLFEKTLASTNKNEFEIDIANLNAGMYFMKIDTDKGMVTSKFIKE